MADDRSPGGTPIDEQRIPAWARDYLSPDQHALERGMQWMLLLYQQPGLDPSRINLAQRFYFATVGKEKKELWHGLRTLAADTHMSQVTVCAATEELLALGWISVTPGRGAGRNRYRLLWPAEDCIARADGPALCGELTKRGGLCTKKAGKGTTHPGEGACYQHGGDRANKTGDALETPPNEVPMLQPLKQESPRIHPESDPEEEFMLQPLKQAPVDNTGTTDPPRLFMLQPLKQGPVDNTRKTAVYQPVMLQPLTTHASTVEDGMLQPLKLDASTVEAEYVRSTRVEYERGVTQPPDAQPPAYPQAAVRRAADGTLIGEASQQPDDATGRRTA